MGNAGHCFRGVGAIDRSAHPFAFTESHDAHGLPPEAVGGVLPGPVRTARAASPGSIHRSPHRFRSPIAQGGANAKPAIAHFRMTAERFSVTRITKALAVME